MSAAALDRRATVDAAAVAIMIGLTFSWGLNGVAAKLSYSGFSPIFIALVRSGLGGAVVFLWCRARGVALFDRDGTLGPGLLAGLLFGIEFILIFVGLEHTTVARSTLLVNTMPFFVLVGAHFWLGERMTARKAGGTLLAFVGVALIFSDKLGAVGPNSLFGDLLSLAGGAFWAATTLVIKGTRLTRAGAEKLLIYQLAVSFVMVLALIPFAGPLLREVAALPTAALLFQALYVVAFTYLLWFWLMRRYPAASLASFAFLTPAFGVLLSGLILGEPLTWRIFAALALIAAGLTLVNAAQRPADER